MKIKYKIIGLFVLSIIISVLVFSITFYYLLDKGYLAGVSPDKMLGANEQVAAQIDNKQLEKQEIIDAIEKANRAYPNMRFSVLLDSDEVIEGCKHVGIASVGEMIEQLASNDQYDRNTWMVAKSIIISGEQGYLITAVDKKDFKTIIYYFNGPKARGVLGKMMLLGLCMTVVITSLVTYLFSRGLMVRMKKIDKGIDAFEIGSLSTRIEDQKKDELGKLAIRFNEMADKIESQVKEQAAYEEKRKQLISNISHDLRTPLSSVIGYSELLLEGDEQEDKTRYLNIIHRKALYMEKLLDQLLEFSRLESGRMVVSLKQGDIVECVREILIEYIPTMDKENIELILELEEEPILVAFDQDKIERVIRNLIDNAFKYGMTKKKLRVAAYRKERQAIIEIEDFGEGMDAETLSHLFERFYRGDKGRSTKVGGMGLGLSIAQEIMKQHHGNIEITSVVKQGTKAMISLKT